MQKTFSSCWLFEVIHIICFEMHMDRRINLPVFSLLGDDHVTVFSLLGDVIHQQAENKQILVLRPFYWEVKGDA